MDKEQLISEILLLPATAIEYYVSQQLVQFFPDKALIEGERGYFNLEGYTEAKQCVLKRKKSCSCPQKCAGLLAHNKAQWVK